MNITKEQADRVTVLAVRIAVWLPGESETGRALKNDAAEIADIMRGLAEDAEPVAQIGMRDGVYVDSTPLLHVGSSAFEDWYQAHEKACTGDKQLARDAYAAGMGDPLVTYATSPQAAQTEAALCEMVRLSEDAGLYGADFQTEAQEREAFEAWLKSEYLQTTREPDSWGRMRYTQSIECMWKGYQAGRAGRKG